ncbi:MAG: STAS domain-containing protein [Casimicrobiaceae bacterium]
MEITSRVYGDMLLVAPTGRVDHATAADFERAVVPLLDAATGPRAGLVFDLDRVTYISSVGLRVLMIASKSLRARGARIAVAAMQPVVAEILEICRFNAVVEVFSTVDAALAAMAPGAASSRESPTQAP